MKEYTANNIELVAFSRQTCTLISSKMQDQFMATTSWPLFVHYTNQGKHWLLIAMLKLKEGVGINEQTLDLNNSLSFDISHLHEAARIDIEKWQKNEQPYLSFIKRRAGDSDVSKYFRNALSCTDYTDAKYNTELTIKAVEDYCKKQNWDGEKSQEARDKLYNFCAEMKQKELPVNLNSLSAHINDQDPESFITFVKESGYEVSDIFSPNPASYKKLMRVSRRFGSISVSFDVDDLRSETVKYREDIDAIVILQPPKELIDDMKRALGELIDAEE
ncbi:nucleoid-associated protein [Pseudomonas gingeri]|uniref:nucleoid-associated protein n=1 Tax=Pseudomonas gingeri TaxID=117681 RepID=UPI00210D6D88|nr:nucleoid-associated protein [Pseudomonas gingeri]